MGYFLKKRAIIQELERDSHARRRAAHEISPYDQSFQEIEQSRHDGEIRGAERASAAVLGVNTFLAEAMIYARAFRNELLIAGTIGLCVLTYLFTRPAPEPQAPVYAPPVVEVPVIKQSAPDQTIPDAIPNTRPKAKDDWDRALDKAEDMIDEMYKELGEEIRRSKSQRAAPAPNGP